jgi:hypothetical protein
MPAQPMLKRSCRRDKPNLTAPELMPFVLGIRIEQLYRFPRRDGIPRKRRIRNNPDKRRLRKWVSRLAAPRMFPKPFLRDYYSMRT